ncbi:MAG: YbaB/EbfC family nucleoid-associated protein [Erysipelotrichaceae bacterium]|jgi:DNA-binding YbaB/EbfC family protein|nr:YbaB/EbfC family nucleoid-associated protein [Bacillota bacterium]NLP22219.1 YbaB/EbfC family nucleoid-associated protein [Erysipelotrichaceae bacterium]
MDFQNLMQQAQRMQSQLGKVEEELKNTKYTGTSGGGSVEIEMTGDNEVVSVKIDEELLEKDNKEILEDLLQVAFNDASKKAKEDRESKLQGLAGGMGLPGMF